MAKSPLERFEEKYIPVPESGCWVWTAFCRPNGYGQFSADGGPVLAHRWAHEHFVGPIPPGMVVMHTCDVPACVNPAHLRLGTQQENRADCVRKKRQALGERNNHAKLTEEQVRAIRDEPSGRPLREIAADYGVTLQAVWYVRRRQTWKHVA